MKSFNIDNYKITYEETDTIINNVFKTIMRVYNNNELILRTDHISEDEFFNSLKYLVPFDVYTKIYEIYKNKGSTNDELNKLKKRVRM